MDFRAKSWQVQPGMNRVVGEGRTCHITPKAMEVLECLARQQGQVVAKEKIFQEVWAGTFVSDDALTRCIGEIRRAFHDDAREPSIIQTIPKRGYLMVAPVVWDPVDTATTKAPAEAIEAHTTRYADASTLWPFLWKHKWILGASGFMLLVVLVAMNFGRVSVGRRLRDDRAGIQRLAVLPLIDLSGDPSQEYFADGMTEELITQLSQIKTWKVISRTSVMLYKGSKKPLRQIARDLLADRIIEGSVRRAGGRVRIAVQLIDAVTDEHLWSGSFERELSDILLLQNGIARAVAAELNITLDQANSRHTRRVQPEAYEALLKGKYFLCRRDYAKARSHLEEASVIDPRYALAHSLLYEAEAMMSFRRDETLGGKALRALERARELDDTLAEVHTGAGDVKFYWGWQWKEGEEDFRLAVELDPTSIDSAIHYVGCLHVLARWDAAIQEYRRALQLDPVSPELNLGLLALFVDAQRYDRAMKQFHQVIELDANNGSAYEQAGSMYAALGREDEAIAAYLQAERLSGKNAEEVEQIGNAIRKGGIRAYWKQRLQQLQERSKRMHVPPFDFATLYAHLGEKDEAMKMLEMAYQQRAPRLVWIRAGAVWEPLRHDPRFQTLIHRMGFPE
jgi:TolB-like protein/DNA-binding winged helix-turn-helix (wHTH) protein/Tfp pilus assembly protein PilF